MSAILSVVEYLANHPALILAAGGAFWGWVRKKDKRAEKIMDLAYNAYNAVEGIAKRNNIISSNSKWERFVELFMDSMKVNGLGEPSGKEMSIVKSWVTNNAHGGHR